MTISVSCVTNRPHEIHGVRIPTLKMIIKRNNVDTVMILTYDPRNNIVTYSDDNSKWEEIGPQLTEQLFQEKQEIIYNNLILKNWEIGHVDHFDLDELKTTLMTYCDSDY